MSDVGTLSAEQIAARLEHYRGRYSEGWKGGLLDAIWLCAITATAAPAWVAGAVDRIHSV